MRPEISELEAIQRMTLFASERNTKLHILHLSTAKGIRFIWQARKQGLPVSVETCPHYLILSKEAKFEFEPYAKCNPPLRDEANRQALIRALKEGQVDCIVSDHSPYTTEAKASGKKGFHLAPPGVNALELGLPLMMDQFVNKGELSWLDVARLMACNPAKLFGIYPQKGHIGINADADFVIVDPDHEWTINASLLQTKNKWSPYDGWRIKGNVVYTLVRGHIVYQDGDFLAGPGFGVYLDCSKNSRLLEKQAIRGF